MCRKWYRRSLGILACAGFILCIYFVDVELDTKQKEVSSKASQTNKVIPGGQAVGIYMETDGVLVLETAELKNVQGNFCEPAKNIVKEGDYLISFNGVNIENKNHLIEMTEALEDNHVELIINRNQKYLECEMQAVEIAKGEYKLGIWIRDSLQGLGTVTYMTEQGDFGALGHGIHDMDIDSLIQMKRGSIYDVEVVGIQKGVKGSPGGLEGVIVYSNSNRIGSLEENTDSGVFGRINLDYICNLETDYMEVCNKKDVVVGPASILCTIEGEVMEYEIEIKRIDYFTRNENKEIVIEIIDEELIKKTGGIVQGMSGSPIIQDGKLVGAVTHVLVNDPTRGYGIFIENMLEAAG